MLDGNINVRQFPEQIYKVGGTKCNCFILKLRFTGDTLYMDLDVVITQNIDCFFYT